MSYEPSEALRGAYSAFLSHDRILFTGHSHQAWPDVARDALAAYFGDAERLADDVWSEAVMPQRREVGGKLLSRMGFAPDDPIAFGQSTHQLVYRLLSALDRRQRPRIVTTTSEFHSLYRQLSRLAEEGFDVVWVDAEPRAALNERLLEAISEGTSLVALSAVLFEDAWIVERLDSIIERCCAVGALCLVDAYHAFNAVPIDWGSARDSVYAVAGGYKYAQFGPGLCWLRFPRDCQLRPEYTGWFSDFESLAEPRVAGRAVRYGEGGARFAGATFDPSATYRARAVLEHFERFDLSLERLREISQQMTSQMVARVVDSGLCNETSVAVASSADPARRGPFVSLRTEHAGAATARLRDRGVMTDARGDLLRLGPAPFLSSEEIDRGMDAVVEVLRVLHCGT